ncbi:HAMP domain-containing sensor histidine kinase [Herbiconiux sp. YIM B11900]|uniref:HAMP domain-containing sensor histidine kinase n=1 Tax=Herbiconiux sp. YIM B11900 TaxID=3404131 RepID=UPI003F872539
MSTRERPATPVAASLRTGSLRTRTVLSVLALLTVLLVALCVSVQLVLGERLRAQIEDRLHDRAAAAAALIGTVSNDDLADRLSAQGVSVLIQSPDGGSVVAGPTPEQLRAGPGPAGPGLLDGPGASNAPAGTSGSEQDAPPSQEASEGAAGTGSAPAAGAVGITSSTITASDAQIVTLQSDLSDGTVLTLTVDASSVAQTLDQLRWIMIAASAAVVIVAAAALTLVVRGSLRPLESMTALARDIAGGDRGRRLRPARPRTEIGRVAAAFDEMLDAVEGAERAARAAERTAQEAEAAAVRSEQLAREAEARVRAFVSDAAHELRTPVAGMQAAADTLVRSSVDRDERERLASHVVREAGRASRLIDDMLLMARVDRGLVLESRPVDLADVVSAEAERQRIRRPDLDLVLALPAASAGPAVVDGDPERLSQIVANLVDNAARMGGGAVTLAVDHVGETVRLVVSDDGPGVPPEDRERIFDRLVRLDSSRNARGGGAGLGLPIARGIARAHGGDLVSVEPSEVGSSAHGAAFALTLPRV